MAKRCKSCFFLSRYQSYLRLIYSFNWISKSLNLNSFKSWLTNLFSFQLISCSSWLTDLFSFSVDIMFIMTYRSVFLFSWYHVHHRHSDKFSNDVRQRERRGCESAVQNRSPLLQGLVHHRPGRRHSIRPPPLRIRHGRGRNMLSHSPEIIFIILNRNFCSVRFFYYHV